MSDHHWMIHVAFYFVGMGTMAGAMLLGSLLARVQSRTLDAAARMCEDAERDAARRARDENAYLN